MKTSYKRQTLNLVISCGFVSAELGLPHSTSLRQNNTLNAGCTILPTGDFITKNWNLNISFQLNLHKTSDKTIMYYIQFILDDATYVIIT